MAESIIVLGVGNVLYGAEGIGCHVAQALMQRDLPPDVRVIDGGTGGFALVSEISEARHIILIDATCDDQPVGIITRLTPRYAAEYPRTLVAHDVGLKDVLDAMQLMERSPAVALFAVSIAPLASLCIELDERMRAVVPELVRLVEEEIYALRLANPSIT